MNAYNQPLERDNQNFSLLFFLYNKSQRSVEFENVSTDWKVGGFAYVKNKALYGVLPNRT